MAGLIGEHQARLIKVFKIFRYPYHPGLRMRRSQRGPDQDVIPCLKRREGIEAQSGLADVQAETPKVSLEAGGVD